MNKLRAFSGILMLSGVLLLMAAMPPQIFAQTEKGIELYNSWQYQEAEKVLRDALKANPTDVAANFYLGMSILLQEKYSEALDIFQKVKADRAKAEPGKASAMPDEYQIQIALSRAHLGLKQNAEAWKILEAAEKAHPGFSDVHVYQGVYYLQMNDPKKAIKELEKAIQLDAKSVYANYYAGHAYLRLGNPQKAVEMFKIFISLAPQAPEVPKAQALITALC
jgi:tetratricopeptide (TPR) repeat protein